MFSQHIENSSLISLINISQEYRIALQVARKIVPCNMALTLGNYDHLLAQTLTKFFPVLPSILSKYQFHFDQHWANITSILTNIDQRLYYWGGCFTPHTPHSGPL
jgi:hypothetical protein